MFVNSCIEIIYTILWNLEMISSQNLHQEQLIPIVIGDR